MIPHRPGLLCPGYLPIWGQGRQAALGIRFYINQRRCTEPVPVFEQTAHGRQQARSERRIQKSYVEPLAHFLGLAHLPGLHRVFQEAERVTVLYHPTDRPPLREPRTQLPNRNSLSFDKSHVGRAAGQGLQAQRATTCKQIQTA